MGVNSRFFDILLSAGCAGRGWPAGGVVVPGVVVGVVVPGGMGVRAGGADPSGTLWYGSGPYFPTVGPYFPLFGQNNLFLGHISHFLAKITSFGPYFPLLGPISQCRAYFPLFCHCWALFPAVLPLLGHISHCWAIFPTVGPPWYHCWASLVPLLASLAPLLGLVLGGSHGQGIRCHCVCGVVHENKRQNVWK